MGIEERISEALARAAMENWNESCNSWRWSEGRREDVRLEIAEILKGVREEAARAALERAFVVEACVYGCGSSDEAQYSCSDMGVDAGKAKEAARALRDEYLELCDGDPGRFAGDGEIMEMDFGDSSLEFPFGQEYVTKRRSAWDFLVKIGADPEAVVEKAKQGGRKGARMR